MKMERYLDYSNKTILLTIIIVAIIGIVLFLHVESVDKLEEVEKGNYSYINSERTQEVLKKRDSKDLTWIHSDINSDGEWNEKFVEGLELYYIDKPEEGVKSKGNGKLNMEETGLYFWNFKIYDRERVYTKLTQEEWIGKFNDLFGKECGSYIFERYL